MAMFHSGTGLGFLGVVEEGTLPHLSEFNVVT